jgi:zinc transport system substrate-binding protein
MRRPRLIPSRWVGILLQMKRFLMKAHHPAVALAIVLALIAPPSLFGDTDQARTARSASTPADQTITIVTTIRPLELIVRDLLGDALQDRLTVTTLLAPNVSPHGFEPTPAQIARLHRADIVIYNGGGLDDWAGRELPGDIIAIRFADISTHHHHHEDGQHHACCAHGHHGSEDEHFWLDVALVKSFAAVCHEQFSQLLRSRFDDSDQLLPQLEAALEQFRRQAENVDQSFAETLQSYQNRRIVTHHNVFSRIAARYHLGDPLVLRPLATVEPSPRDLRRAIRTVRAERIAAILVEPQFNSAAADRIRDETNVRLVAVDPLGSTASSWAEMMDSIRAAIAQSFDSR